MAILRSVSRTDITDGNDPNRVVRAYYAPWKNPLACTKTGADDGERASSLLAQAEGRQEGTIANSVECLTAESIVEICKDMGLFLCAEPGRGVTGELHNRGGIRYYRLHLGVPASEQMSNKPGYSDGMEQGSSIIWVAQELHREIWSSAKTTCRTFGESARGRSSQRFVYIDVSDFSRHKPGTQVHIVSSLVRIVRIDGYWLSGYGRYAREGLESMICIGDGYIYVFRKPSHAVMFAGYLAHLIEHLSAIDRLQGMDIHFRAGVHTGDVYCFWDFGRDRWNYIGAGINGGQRGPRGDRQRYRRRRLHFRAGPEETEGGGIRPTPHRLNLVGTSQ